MRLTSKLPHIGTNIFTIMSSLARKHNAINLAQGFPNFDTPLELRELVSKYLMDAKNQYVPMMGVLELRQSIMVKTKLLYGFEPDINTEICVTSGASEAIFTSILALVHSGDEVIVIEPSYDSYEPAILLAGAKKVSYIINGPEFNIDWNELALLITDKTRMIIVNTPHNPTGKILQKEDLNKLSRITDNTDILILSDEVYEHLVYDNQKHHSLLSHPTLRKRTVAISSFGKTFHCTGWKVGYCIAPSEIMKEIAKIHQFNVFCVPSFIQYALAEYLETPDNYRGLATFYQKKRDLFNELMSDSPFLALPCEGSFFQLYDYSNLSSDDDLAFAKKLTIENGVASIPISSFYTKSPSKQYIRFCFAKKENTLIEAASILKNIH